MKQLNLTARVDLEAAASDERPTPRFRMLAYTGKPMRVQGWSRPVVVELDGIERRSDRLPILKDHATSLIVGHSESFSRDESGLVVEGRISGGGVVAEEVVAAASRGFPWQASVGLDVLESEDVGRGETVLVNGSTHEGPITVARRSKLREVSFVAIGADDETTTTIAARAAEGTLMDENTTLEAARTEHAADLRRIAAIRKACADEPELAAEAIEKGWTVEQAENLALKAKNKRLEAASFTAPNIRFGGTGEHRAGASDTDVLAAAFMQRAGLDEQSSKAFGEEAATRASDLGARSLVDVMAAGLRMAGRDVPGSTDGVIRAFGSTRDLPVAFRESISKSLQLAYQGIDQTWRSFAGRVTARDFKDHKVLRPYVGEGLEKLGKGSALKHSTLGEDATANRAHTYARLIELDRQDIINDDASVIGQIPPIYARQAARTVSDVAYAAFMDNASHFTAGNGNYFDGADSALSVDSLSTAVRKLREQTDESGMPLMISPRVLLVPPALEMTARQIVSSAEIDHVLDASADPGQYGTGNPLRSIADVVVEPRLANSNFTGSSDDAWYLLGGPADMPLTMTFLNGREEPMVESEDAPFDFLGVRWRVYLDCGAALHDERAGVKSKGAG